MHSSASSQPVSLPSPQGLELDLARFRNRAGVSLEHISKTTKIGLRFLEAIECERFERLPGGIFSTSYLRQYAVAIGYDEDSLVAHYNRKMEISEPSPKGPQVETATRSTLFRWLKTAAQASREAAS